MIGAVDKLLSKKGLAVSYGNVLQSVQNYIPAHEVIDSEEFQTQIDKNLEIIIAEVAKGQKNKVKKYSLKNKFIYIYFPQKNGNCDYRFSISSGCTGCGICKNICPVDNILLENGRPTFRHNCELCLGCLHACPAKAIEWTRSTIGKRRYRNPHISLKELITFNSPK